MTSEQYLTFTLRGNLYAAPVSCVQEVLEYTKPDKLPCTQDYIEGIISSRGHGIQVINLCRQFGLEPLPETKHTRIIVFELKGIQQEAGGQDQAGKERAMIFGAVADSVEEVMDIDLDGLESVPKFGNDIAFSYIAGIAKKGEKFVILLDLSRIFLEEGNLES